MLVLYVPDHETYYTYMYYVVVVLGGEPVPVKKASREQFLERSLGTDCGRHGGRLTNPRT